MISLPITITEDPSGIFPPPDFDEDNDGAENWDIFFDALDQSVASSYLFSLAESLRTNPDVTALVLSIRSAAGYEVQVMVAKTATDCIQHTWSEMTRMHATHKLPQQFDPWLLTILGRHLKALEAARGDHFVKDVYCCTRINSFYFSYGATDAEKAILRAIGTDELLRVFEEMV